MTHLQIEISTYIKLFDGLETCLQTKLFDGLETCLQTKQLRFTATFFPPVLRFR